MGLPMLPTPMNPTAALMVVLRGDGSGWKAARVRSDEARHDLFAEEPHALDLAVELARPQAHPELGRAGVGQRLDAGDPVTRVSGQREPRQRVLGEPEL